MGTMRYLYRVEAANWLPEGLSLHGVFDRAVQTRSGNAQSLVQANPRQNEISDKEQALFGEKYNKVGM